MIKEYELKPLNTEGKIYIGIPRERLYIPYFVDNRDQILMTLQKEGRSCGYYQHEGHRVDRNRDRIVEQFLSLPDKPEWLQFLDSDMDHPRDISLRLAKWGKPIIAGLYFHRSKSYDPFCFKEAPVGKDDYGRETKLWAPMRDEVYQFLIENNVPHRDGALTIDETESSPLVECDAVATGTMLIHRSVLEIMNKPVFEYRAGGNSEDMIFCYEAKHDYGIPIYCDLSTISGHYIFSPIGQSQFRNSYLNRGLLFAGYTKREMIDLVAEFFDISFEVAKDKLDNGNAHMAGDYWLAKFGKKVVTNEQVEEFYKDSYVGHLYLIELIHWNFTPVFHNIKSLFTGVRNQRVLEIGSGIGSLAIQLAIQKNEVTAAETNEVLNDFAELRIRWVRDQVMTEMSDIIIDRKGKWNNQPDSYYDTIVSVDTFEHMTSTQVQKMLKSLARVIKEEGSLIYHANFGQQELYPMHFDHSEMWDTWLLEAGFYPLSNTHAIRRSSQNDMDS